MGPDEIKNEIEKATIALSTVNKENRPHSIAVMYAKVKDNKVIITNNYMKSTIENLKNNPYVSLVFWKGEQGWRINGKAEYHDSGKWLNFIKKLEENKNEPSKGAIVISIEEIQELG